jgi:hypothetical protein
MAPREGIFAMSMTPRPDNGKHTAVMTTHAAEAAALDGVVRWLAAAKRRRKRRLALASLAGILPVAAIVGGWLLFQRSAQPLVVSVQAPREASDGPVMRPASQPAPWPPAPTADTASRTTDAPSSPRQTFGEILAGRNREHSIIASVGRDEIHISSSRPGYVYLLAGPATQSDPAALPVIVLFPGATDTSNRIRPGQALTVPARKWPENARVLALVSDEPRHLDGLGPLAGTVICGATTRCSESYGAVIVSRDQAHDTARRPITSTAPAVRPTSEASRRCSDILERASLGEALTDDEQLFLRRNCR